jgi:hypothetical protein
VWRWPWVPRWLYEEAKERARIAEDRLYAAHKDQYVIPPREAVTSAEPKVLETLPEKLRGFVNNWESSETRQALEQEARKLLEVGMGEERIIELWQARTGEGERTE